VTIHRIATRDRENYKGVHKAEHRDPWSAARQAWLERLESGPQLKGPPMSIAPECRHFGWADWVRDANGRVIYGDCRQVLTPAGQEQLDAWRAEGRKATDPPKQKPPRQVPGGL